MTYKTNVRNHVGMPHSLKPIEKKSYQGKKNFNRAIKAIHDINVERNKEIEEQIAARTAEILKQYEWKETP